MTIYACGFNAAQLSSLSLEANIYLKGVEVFYCPSTASLDWDNPRELVTRNTKPDWEEDIPVDVEEIVLQPGDTVILRAYTPYQTIYNLRQDEVEVVIISTQKGLEILT